MNMNVKSSIIAVTHLIRDLVCVVLGYEGFLYKNFSRLLKHFYINFVRLLLSVIVFINVNFV